MIIVMIGEHAMSTYRHFGQGGGDVGRRRTLARLY